ncbi:hypothetical protein [Alishewanella sp. HL-SH06]|uniref:hypothetical protein n=1 Tax=Alishewanella sp. HL-SH06 TaxID=3461144 RepID=UPI0040423B6E
MSEVTYLSGWKAELCIMLDTDYNDRADFNRLLVKNVPSTEDLQKGGIFENANRELLILRLKQRFDDFIEEGASHKTLHQQFSLISRYLRWCDKHDLPVFTQSSLESYLSAMDKLVMLGNIKSSTYCRIRSQFTTLFTKYLDLPYSYFDYVVLRDKSDSEPFEAYTRSDLNQLLPFLRQLFKQTYSQFIVEPEKYFNTPKNAPDMTFYWQGQQHLLYAGITKMMCAATYLLAYYTHANTGELFKLKHPHNASMTISETWFTMPAFKRRAFKTIQVEMGGHELGIPKYALDFFNKLLSASKLIDQSENATLLQTIILNKRITIKSGILTSFLRSWVDSNFNFTDKIGRRLRPVVSRFRETGAQLTAYHQSELANEVLLNNNRSTRSRHYSAGSKIANNGMMQDVMAIREEQVKSKVNTKQAQENLNIKVLVIEAEYKVNIPNLSRTINGASCADPFGEKSEKYTKQAQSRGLAREGERLACADLLACFGCPHQVVVQSVVDIWCLLSFKACIEESLYLHLDSSHYRSNFEVIIQFIEEKILPIINNKILKKAESKLNDEGYHPAWGDTEAILKLIPKI